MTDSRDNPDDGMSAAMRDEAAWLGLNERAIRMRCLELAVEACTSISSIELPPGTAVEIADPVELAARFVAFALGSGGSDA